jgi:hypothetical protein
MKRRFAMLSVLVLMVLALAAPASASPYSHIHLPNSNCVDLGNGGAHPGHQAVNHHPDAAATTIAHGTC